MNRRTLLTLLGLAPVSAPLIAKAAVQPAGGITMSGLQFSAGLRGWRQTFDFDVQEARGRLIHPEFNIRGERRPTKLLVDRDAYLHRPTWGARGHIA
jgi:hypothetical protein